MKIQTSNWNYRGKFNPRIADAALQSAIGNPQSAIP
jgi:hypothetical protein